MSTAFPQQAVRAVSAPGSHVPGGSHRSASVLGDMSISDSAVATTASIYSEDFDPPSASSIASEVGLADDV